jgi:predicted TIM-barrel fold metal-dependent hydrolase
MDPIRFPPQSNAQYTPGLHTVWDNAVFEHRLGCEHTVMIQPSFYGNDNTFMIDSLKAYDPDRARAVVVFDAANITTQQLQEWDELGVRGVRLNFATSDEIPPAAELEKTLRQYAETVKPFDWAIQLYISMDSIPGIEAVVPTLGARVVFDHIGNPTMPEPSLSPKRFDPYQIDGFGSMVRLLQQGTSYVKISGPYRLSKLPGPDYVDIDPLVLELLRVAPSRLVYGSDWPHTRFEGLDIKPWTEHLLDLVHGDIELARMLFRDNAVDLWNRRQVNVKF